MIYTEINERIDTIRNLHIDSDRDRIRAVMNGGAEGIQAVLAWGSDNPGKDAAALGVDLPTANIMWSGLERLAQKIGRPPVLKTDMLPIRDNAPARKKAEKRARIVSAWDEMSRIEMQYPQIGRWLPGYGYTMHRIKEATFGDTTYPVAELRDPYDVYPGWFGAGQQPEEVAVIRRIPGHQLRRIYPDLKSYKPKRTLSSVWGRSGTSVWGRGGWEGNGGDLEVIEYINTEGSYVVCTETTQVLSFIPNPLTSGPAFVVTKRFSFDKLKSQYTHTFGLMAMMAKLNLLGLIAAEDTTFREINVFGEMLSTKYEKGRDAINFFEPGVRVEKPTSDQINQTFQAINIIERQFRIVAGYDVAQDGQSPNSFATGEGIKELGSSADLNVREYQTAIKHSMELIDTKRLEWEDKMHASKTKRVYWYEGSAPFEEEYTPNVDINGDYRTKRIYGAMATFDESSKIIAGLQLVQARIMDRRTMQENLDDFPNPSLVNERIDQDQAKDMLLQSLGQRAAQGDPAADMALVEIMDNPKMATDTLKKIFTPQEPQMSPEEQAMIAGGGMGGMGGPPGQDQLQGGPPPGVSTILSQMESAGGGAMTVGQMQ
jgi:hypothetical protein